ncbi:MAG TPA: phosphatidylglycerophosphatase A [Sulfurovum sp.]|jgi:phosphatidylglycerophosphatase A|nr:MAG: phosphatidylglycerophosphatase A [Sulfurovum sp. 35-42-20]OYZ25909.1 MAG: phosphatidylglycerophosphatase A [Sulfurovum sp. 16-42-52]OYZ48414.1 MAG: phosphatidylglycerophosphatase A [Sulfurovum sp. 24-42-9]OZA46798.1 MAG: phosphatidylglycerophosphatase A [Sulfurovum sp. 17-42-90]OZA60004.1 MAG: phosphatidylglycerophosphatase A [Sulfurovum sp. 39-42-12]HQR73510.1 phosphatidylglycerophosphatase A [Sulfurovum sp.]
MTLQKLFLTFGGAGLSPKAPGTVGTLASLPVGILVLYTLGMETLFMLTLTITVIGIFEINKYEKTTGIHDQQHIVIDEAAGMWLSLMIAYSTAITLEYAYADILAIVLSFATFRLFDIWKPSTIGWIDRELKGGLGVMLDDVLAGIAGGLLSVLLLMGIDKVF